MPQGHYKKRKWHNYLENNVLEIFSFLFDYRDLSGYQMIYLCIFKLVGQVKRFVTNYVYSNNNLIMYILVSSTSNFS